MVVLKGSPPLLQAFQVVSVPLTVVMCSEWHAISTKLPVSVDSAP